MTDVARRCWRRIRGGASGGVGTAQRAKGTEGAKGARRFLRSRHKVSVVVGVLAVAGTVAGVLVATVGGRPAAGPGSYPVVPATRPAPGRSASPVVPVLGGTAGTGDSSFAVPVARLPARADRGSPPSAKVAPLHGLRQADLLVVAPFSLSGRVLAAVSRLGGVTGTVPIEAAMIQINGRYVAVLGVDPSTFRGYAAGPTAASNSLWQGVADGGVAVSYTMGTLDRLSLGGKVTVAGRSEERLPVVAFGTVGIGGVDAVVSDAVARSLGMPAGNAIVVTAPPASAASLAARIKAVLPRGAAVEPLVTEEAGPSGVGLTAGDGAATEFMSTSQLTAALRAAESRRGLPYVWGAAGPTSFDCSGLVQWAFAQAGVPMPRVAADQARAGPAVPVSQLEPGDLLFYYTDPTAPGYVSHVAIYLGNGWMIQAPEPGMDVQVVPASFGAQFAGAIRVDPRIAAEVAGGLA
jgi:cell wall-associated NlpC family hydrolase